MTIRTIDRMTGSRYLMFSRADRMTHRQGLRNASAKRILKLSLPFSTKTGTTSSIKIISGTKLKRNTPRTGDSARLSPA
ncbi:MAG: hypothetical protein LBK13_04575, partial [Spirochaetales bacterium]|nr:hypothetical protein [Spirochaetales bacterium]